MSNEEKLEIPKQDIDTALDVLGKIENHLRSTEPYAIRTIRILKEAYSIVSEYEE